MKKSIAIAGNSGSKVRSDCEITLELKNEGGIIIDLNSKVIVLYGESIKELTVEILQFFGIKNAVVKITDTGALPFVIAARLECCLLYTSPSPRDGLLSIPSAASDVYKRQRTYC